MPPLTFSRPPLLSITDVGVFVGASLNLAFMVAGVLVFVYLVWGGIQYLTSGGDSSKVQEAQSRITTALIGFSILAVSYAIIRLISYFFGIQLIGDVPIPQGF